MLHFKVDIKGYQPRVMRGGDSGVIAMSPDPNGVQGVAGSNPAIPTRGPHIEVGSTLMVRSDRVEKQQQQPGVPQPD